MLTPNFCIFFSRSFTVRGTKGMYQEDGDYVFLEKYIDRDIAE